MNNDQPQSEHAQDPRDPMNIATLLRAAADGELSDCQCKELDAYLAEHPEAKSQIEFEKALKNCCSRAMTKPPCPDSLRNKVASIVAHSANQIVAEAQQEQDAFAQRIEDTGEYTRSQSFWARRSVIGIAAALLMMVAGTLIWQSTSFSSGPIPNGLNIQQASYYNRVSDFVVREHNRCCDDKAAKSKLVEHDINQATQYFSNEFGAQVVVPDMEQSVGEIVFYGSGDCSVPSTSRSGHLRFDAISPDGEYIALSLFISPDPGLLPLSNEVTFRLDSKACKDSGASLFAWVQDGVQYLLVSEASADMCAKVRAMMKAPSSLDSI